MENGDVRNEDAVLAVERAWREGLRNIPKYRAHAEAPFTEEDYASIREVIDQFGERFATEMTGTFLSQKERYLVPIMWQGGCDFPSIHFLLVDADSLAQEMFARASISFEPRRIDIDWAHIDPVEEAWRKGMFTAMGTQGICCWVLSGREKAAKADLITRYGEGRAAILVERVLLHWERYCCIAPVRWDIPTLDLIATHADTWIDLAENYAGPPPHLDDSDALPQPVGACGAVEEVWREAIARELPARADEAENESWTERDEELIAALTAALGEAIVIDAVRSFAAWWRKGRGLHSLLPSRDDFARFCLLWCQEKFERRGGVADGACGHQ